MLEFVGLSNELKKTKYLVAIIKNLPISGFHKFFVTITYYKVLHWKNMKWLYIPFVEPNTTHSEQLFKLCFARIMETS